VQRAEDSTHPAPFVTHPVLYEAHAAFVVRVVAARVQALVAQLDVELTTQPVNQVSLQADSVNY
jgi:hypothetical protein